MRPLILIGLPFFLLACGDKSDDTGDVSEYETDDDADGYSEADGDCDDTDATISPDAEELCDGIDNDCDGVLDDGAGDMQVFYYDLDGDGAGDENNTVEACDTPANAVGQPGDCDDLDPEVHPMGVETCNGIDDDCDGLVDDADDGVDKASYSTWHTDADGDGYGDSEDPGIEACEGASGTVDNAEDCDDSDAVVNPGATEVCDSADVDEDCDGLSDDADDSVYVGTQTTWYPDADSDGFGDDDSAVISCEEPSTDELDYILDPGDCQDDDETTFPGAVEVCGDGVVNDCDGVEEDAEAFCAWNTDFSYTDADMVVLNEEDDYFSYSAAAGDLDGDGTEDLVIGSAWSSEGEGYGRIYALHGPLSAAEMSNEDDVAIESREDESDTLGVDLRIGDVDGDGYDDIWTGAPGYDGEDESNFGAGYLVHGPVSSGTITDLATLLVIGEDDNDNAGSGMALVGDMSGDGVQELLMGAPYNSTGATYGGAVYLLDGSLTGTQEDVSDVATAAIYGDRYSWLGGTRMQADNTDIDGDGTPDLVLSTSYDDEVYAFLGPVSGELDLDDVDLRISDDSDENSSFGEDMVGDADWDGDGYTDFIVSDPFNEASGEENGGAVYVIQGPLSADHDIADGVYLTVYGGEDANLGGNITLGDFDGDGNEDLLLGCGQYNQTGNSASSSSCANAFIQLGPISGTVQPEDISATIVGDEVDTSFGQGTVALGDQDGDGTDEAGILASMDDLDGWLLFGTPSY